MKIAKILLKSVTLLALLGGISSHAQATNVVYSVNMVGFQKIDSSGLLSPNSNLKMVSTPFLAGDTDINVAIGEQLTTGNTPAEGDNLIFYTPGIGYETVWRVGNVGNATFDNKWVKIVGGNPVVATNNIVPGSGFWVQNVQNVGTTQEIVFVGEVITDTNVNVSVASGLQMLSFPYSSDFDLPNDDSFSTSGATTGNTVAEADNIIVWDDLTASYQTFFLVGNVGNAAFDFKWIKDGTNPPEVATDPIKSGQAFWYQHQGAGFTWSTSIPY